MSSPVATIDVVATDDRANELLRDVIELVGSLGAAEHTKRARSVLANLPADTLRHAIESFFPRCWTMLSVFAY
jgi:hypothetical protein